MKTAFQVFTLGWIRYFTE